MPSIRISEYVLSLITPAVLVAFISGGATVFAAYLAAGGHIDKTICGINSTQMRDVMQKNELYIISKNNYLSSLSTEQATNFYSKKLDVINNFNKVSLNKSNEAIKNGGKAPMPNDAVYTAFDIVDIIRPLNDPAQIPPSEEVQAKGIAALDSLNAAYSLCPK